jgi:hypothetical protein
MAGEYLFYLLSLVECCLICCISFPFSDIYENIIVKCATAWTQAKVLNPLKKAVVPIRPEVLWVCALHIAC